MGEGLFFLPFMFGSIFRREKSKISIHLIFAPLQYWGIWREEGDLKYSIVTFPLCFEIQNCKIIKVNKFLKSSPPFVNQIRKKLLTLCSIKIHPFLYFQPNNITSTKTNLLSKHFSHHISLKFSLCDLFKRMNCKGHHPNMVVRLSCRLDFFYRI